MVPTSNLQDPSGRPFASSYSSQSAAGASGYHHSGGMQGLHNNYGGFNVQNMPGSLASRNAMAAAMGGVPSGNLQQPGGGGISGGRFGSSTLPVQMSQLSHGSSHGHSAVANRGGISVAGNPAFSSSMNGVGGSLPGISSNSVTAGNRNSVQGMGTSQMLGNMGPRITNSLGNIVSGSNIGRSISSGGMSVPSLGSRVNLTANSGSGSLNLQGPNRLMGSMLQQAPQMLGMLGNAYPSSGGPLSQNQVQGGNNALNSMGMLNDVNTNDSSPFDINDFPQLSGRPSSAGGPQGQLGSLRKQGVGVSSIVQQSQEFSIQNEDFPALPGFKGGSSDYPMDLHQKEQHHDNVSMMQSQHFPMGRTSGFNLSGTYSSARQQHQLNTSVGNSGVSFTPGSNQDLMHLHSSDLFQSSHGNYLSQIQNSGHSNIGMRPLNAQNPTSNMGAYEQLMQQYQQHPQNQSRFRLQQLSAVNQSYNRDQSQSVQTSQNAPDRFGLLGLLSVIRMNDPDLSSLALGIDLTTLGLNLNSSDNLYKTFSSPWSDEPSKGDPEFNIPACYYAKHPPPLQQAHFTRFQLVTLFYIFYSMPRDEAQLYAAHELYNRGWFYHKELRQWMSKIQNVEPSAKTNTYERSSYHFFDPEKWESDKKENFVLYYDAIEKQPAVPQH